MIKNADKNCKLRFSFFQCGFVMTNWNAAPAVKLTIKGCLWITCGLIILEMKAENEPSISLPVCFKSVKKKKQNKTKQRRTNRPNKRKNKSPSAGVEPRTFKVWGQRVCQYAPRQLTLNKSVKIFCPWNSTGRRCLKQVELYLWRIERFIRGNQAWLRFDSKSRTWTHFVAFKEHLYGRQAKCLAKPSRSLLLTALYSLQFSTFTWGESIMIQQHAQ